MLGALLAAVAVIAVASASRDDNGRIEITATALRLGSIESGAPGRQSNVVEQVWALTDRSGAPIGRMLVMCRWLRPQVWRLCVGEVNLPLGKLVWQGSTQAPLAGTVAVTGGTGRYNGNGGELEVTPVGLRKVVLSFKLM